MQDGSFDNLPPLHVSSDRWGNPQVRGPARAYAMGCRCSDCRAHKRVQHAARRDRLQAQGVRAGTARDRARAATRKPCAVCAEPVRNGAGRGGGAAVHKACRDEYRRRRAPRERLERRAAKAARGGASGRLFLGGNCAICGAAFVSTFPNSRTCSDRCGKRGAIRKYHLSGGDRIAIADAAGWKCAICLLDIPVMPSKRLAALSMDHIVPKSLGGTDDVSNLRPVHMYCNALRGNRVGVPDEDLRAQCADKLIGGGHVGVGRHDDS